MDDFLVECQNFGWINLGTDSWKPFPKKVKFWLFYGWIQSKSSLKKIATFFVWTVDLKWKWRYYEKGLYSEKPDKKGILTKLLAPTCKCRCTGFEYSSKVFVIINDSGCGRSSLTSGVFIPALTSLTHYLFLVDYNYKSLFDKKPYMA